MVPAGGGVAALGGEGQIGMLDGQADGGRVVRRRRRANVAGGRRRVHAVWVSPEEEAALLRLAGEQQVTVSRLLVESALAVDRGETVTERRALLTELFRLERQVAGVAVNVNQVAKVANATGRMPAELSGTLDAARATMQRIEETLYGLGLS